MSKGKVHTSIADLSRLLIVGKFATVARDCDDDPHPAFDTESTLPALAFLKLKIFQIIDLLLYHRNCFNYQWAKDDWTKNMVDTRMNLVRISTDSVETQRSCNVGLVGQANANNFRLIFNLLAFVLLVGGSRIPTVAEYDRWHDRTTVAVKFNGQTLAMNMDGCLQHNVFLLYRAFMQIFPLRNFAR